jgi:hypothetical protein
MQQQMLRDAVEKLCKPSNAPEAAEVKAALLKQLKSHAKQGDFQVQEVFDALWDQLTINSSSVRTCGLQVGKRR